MLVGNIGNTCEGITDGISCRISNKGTDRISIKLNFETERIWFGLSGGDLDSA